MMTDLSILIPARNEVFLSRTIEDVLENITSDTEIIAVCDGNWPTPAVQDHPRVNLIYHSESIGQRAATNEAARLSQAKFIMKLDAHCCMDKGFDTKLMADCEYDWTVVPRMLNLHAFDWECQACGNRTYQGPKPVECVKCDELAKKPMKQTAFKRTMVWDRRPGRRSDYMWFSTDLRFSYFDRNYLKKYGSDANALKQKYNHSRREWARPKITDQMCAIGACWMMHRERYWDLDGVDEGHGSWGQMGVEIAMKSWLSGGRQVVNKNTWFAHLFRTQGGDFGFPYPLSGGDVRRARKYSQNLWLNNVWPKAKRPLSWLIEKFSPLPGWDEELDNLKKKEGSMQTQEPKQEPLMPKKSSPSNGSSKGIVYYTDNRCEERIMRLVRDKLTQICNGYEIISVSQYPIDWGKNIVMPLLHSPLSMFKQMLRGLQESDADIIFFAEHDVLYHPTHFDFTPAKKDVFYYNEHTWKVDAKTGQALFYHTKQTSGLCAHRELLLEHYTKRLERVEKEGFSRSMGFEPGTHRPPKGVDSYKAESFWSKYPNVDIRHSSNLTANRFKKEQFRSERSIRGWTEADEVVGWGKTKGRFNEFLQEVAAKEAV